MVCENKPVAKSFSVNYPKRVRKMTDAQLRWIVTDAVESSMSDYHAFCVAELHRRKDRAMETLSTGLTKCCNAMSTYHDETLCCKVCWNEVPDGEGDGGGEAIELVFRQPSRFEN